MGALPGRLGHLSAFAAALSVAALMLARVAAADTALWVHGATAGEIPVADVLRRVPPGYTLREVDYPAGLWPWTGLTTATGAQSIAVGVGELDKAIRAVQGQGQTLVIGESLGSLVVDQELRNLAGRPDAPDPSAVRFEVFAAPGRPGGLFSYLPVGGYEPLTGTVTQRVPDTRYDVTVVKLQYDGIASWPDRPWHLLAVLNALAGGIVYHGTDHYGIAAQDVLNARVPQENIATVANSAGGVTTSYSVQQTPALLHLLEPVLPRSVATVDRVLTRAINLGYSELTPDAGPHLAPGGALVDKFGTPVFSPARTAVFSPARTAGISPARAQATTRAWPSPGRSTGSSAPNRRGTAPSAPSDFRR